MIMNTLVYDNIIDILSYLINIEKILFLSLSKELHALKNKVYYDEFIDIDKIQHLWYYNRFTHIE